MHARARILAFGLFASLIVAPGLRGEVTDHQLKLSLDPLLDLTKVWSLTGDAIEEQFTESGFKENPFLHWSNANTIAEFSKHPYANIRVDLSLFDGALPLEQASVTLDDDNHKAHRVDFVCAKSDAATMLRSKLDNLFQVKAQAGPRAAIGWKADLAGPSEIWMTSGGIAVLAASPSSCKLTLLRPGSDPASAVTAASLGSPKRGRELAFFARLDDLMPFPGVWSMSQDALDAIATVEDIGMKESPFYKWNTTARDSARFAQKMFSNTTTDLLLFNDTVNAEEANIEFKNGRASKLVVTLLTRGNSGEVSAAKFDEVFKATGRALGTKLGVRPTPTTVAGRQIIKTTAYLWTTPHTLALMEFNTDAPKGKVEFLRLTFTPAAGRAELLNLAGIGSNATTLSKASLVKSVKRDQGTGDVEIAGVPMRDQGQKGYCVAASCERLFRYLGQPTDMDEIAQLVETDAERGTNPAIMYGQLKKIDERYNVRVKLLKIPPRTSLGPVNISKTELERAQKADLGKLIHENIDQGLPLLWAVLLDPSETGLSPNGAPPPISPVRPRNGVGHMRMIIGYNAKTGGVIYTDSWGAGHERKVMTLPQAESMTEAVFAMVPSK